MGGSCGGDPNALAGALIAWFGALALVVGGGAALALKVLQNAKDVQAAWRQLRLHEAVLNGDVDAARRGKGP